MHHDIFPRLEAERGAWLRRALSRSTARLRAEPVQEEVVASILNMVRGMRRGHERDHLRALLRQADYRGSDVKLSTQVLVYGYRQAVPHPAFCWDWRSAQ